MKSSPQYCVLTAMARNSRARKSSQRKGKGPDPDTIPKKTKSMAELMGINPINFTNAGNSLETEEPVTPNSSLKQLQQKENLRFSEWLSEIHNQSQATRIEANGSIPPSLFNGMNADNQLNAGNQMNTGENVNKQNQSIHNEPIM